MDQDGWCRRTTTPCHMSRELVTTTASVLADREGGSRMPLRCERDPEEHQRSVRSGQTNTNACSAIDQKALRESATCNILYPRESNIHQISLEPRVGLSRAVCRPAFFLRDALWVCGGDGDGGGGEWHGWRRQRRRWRRWWSRRLRRRRRQRRRRRARRRRTRRRRRRRGRWRRWRRRRRWGQLQEARVGLERGAELDELPALLVKSLEGSSAPSAPPRKPMRSFSASHTTHYRGTDCTN